MIYYKKLPLNKRVDKNSCCCIWYKIWYKKNITDFLPKKTARKIQFPSYY